MYIIPIWRVRIRKTINAAGDEKRGRRTKKKKRENNSLMMFRRVARWDRINLVPNHSIDTISRDSQAINNDMLVRRRRESIRCPLWSSSCSPPPAGFAPGLFFQISAGGARVIYSLAFFFIGISACSLFFLSPLFLFITKDKLASVTRIIKTRTIEIIIFNFAINLNVESYFSNQLLS